MSHDVNHLSASSLKTYQQCPKQFFYDYISDIDGIEDDGVEHFQVGNSVHDSAQNVLERGEDVLSLSEEDLLEELREEELSLDYDYDDSEKVQTCLEFAAKFISKYVTSITTVEDKLEMHQDGIHFSGYADLIGDIDDDLSDVVIDWKTGKENPEWKERIQGGMYVKMFYEEYGSWPESIRFVYLNEGTQSVHNRVSDGEVMWNDHQNKYWDEIQGYISNIQTDAYNEEWEAKPESSKCHWCSFKYACDSYIGSETSKPEQIEISGVI